jgi:ribosomal protein L23
MAKTAAKTTTNPKAKKNERDLLADELKKLIPKLDEECLAFLIEQAQVHLYNVQVEALNDTIIKSQERKAAAAAKGGAKGKTASADASGGFSDIKVSDSGSSYYIVYKTEWIMFNKDELTSLVKIATSAGAELDIKERLFNWLSRERSDLLRSAGISAKFDPKLKSLAQLLKKRFKVKNS